MWRFKPSLLRSWKKSPSAKIKPSPATYRYLIQKFIFLLLLMRMKSNFSSKTLKWNLIVLPMTFHPNFLKIASCIVLEWLSNFFNKFMTIGEFLDSWQIAHVTPIPKVRHPSSSSTVYIDQCLISQYCQNYLHKFLSQSILLFDRTQSSWQKTTRF